MQLTITVNPRDPSELRLARGVLDDMLADLAGDAVALRAGNKAETKPEKKSDSSKPAASSAPAESKTVSSESTSAAVADTAAAESKPLDYKADVQPLILKMAGVDREKAMTLLGEFGVKNGKDLKPEQYAAVVAKFSKALEG